jgi:hypothetical protein
MKSKNQILLTLLTISLIFGSTGNGEEKSPKTKMLESPSGYRAEFVALEGEGEGKTLIWKGKLVVAEVPDSKPISFSPKQDILLLAEHAPDDDLRHFLLNLGEGEFKKKGERLDYVFGGRYVKGAKWSADGKTLTLLYIEGLASKPQESFDVGKLLEKP